MTRRRFQILYALCIFAISLSMHHRLPSQPWTYDDLDHIEAAQRAQSDWTEIFSPQSKEPARWVLNTYFYFAYKIFDQSPAGYHAVNIPLHGINALLCAYLILQLFKKPLLAGLSGLLFVLSCAPYEAVYKISATGLLFGTTAALLSVLCTHYHLETKRSFLAVFAGAAYAVAIFSYESLISVLIPALYLWWTHKPRTIRLPTALFLPLIVFVILDITVYATADYKFSFNAITLGWHIFSNFGFFLARLFLNAYVTPFGWDVPPPFDIAVKYFSDYAIIGGIIALLLLLLSHQSLTLRFASVWIGATLSPYLFGTNQFYFSRYWYLSSVGGALVFSFVLDNVYDRLVLGARYKLLLLTSALLILVVSSLEKSHYYQGRFLADAANFYLSHKRDAQTAATLYERVENDYHIQNPMIFHHKALAYGKLQDYEKAQRAILTAIDLRPNYAKSYLVLSAISYETGAFDTAIDAIQYAIQLDEHLIQDMHELAVRLKTDRHYDHALSAYNRIIEGYPNYSDTFACYLGISELLYLKKRYQESLSILGDLLQIQPDHLEAKQLLIKLQDPLKSP
jgi:tetratricopeptide (TPR) repeat protein